MRRAVATSPSPLPRCRRSRRRPSFSIPHPLTLRHTLPHLTSHPQTLFSANLTGSSAFTRTETKSRSRRVGAATCPWRLIEMKGKVLCGVCVDEMGAVEKAGKKEKDQWHDVVERRKATEPTW